MRTSSSSASAADRPKAVEIQEFVRFRTNGDLVPVHHYRTVYHPDGRISYEALSAEALVEKTIRAFQGDAHHASGGALLGLFSAPQDAKDCAQAIADHHGKPVEVSGTQLTVTL